MTAPDQSVFKMRLESEPPQQPAQALASLPPDLDVSLGEKIARMSEVTGASLAFLSSTLTKLSEWAQDEILPTPVPMTIDVRNVAFTLTDDNPPVLRLVRDKSGMFTVTAAPVSGGS